MRCVLWNVQWAGPRSKRRAKIAEAINLASPDVVCLTESTTDFIPLDGGHAIFSDANYGYANTKQRRKVLLWSRWPWSDVSSHSDRGFPPGRIVSGTTREVRFHGVCVPWSAAHVSTGRRDRARWEDHLTFLKALSLLIEQESHLSLVILGDFNQAIPHHRQPSRAYSSLEDVISRGVVVHTRDRMGSNAKPLIDHVMTNSRLTCGRISTIPAQQDGRVLSDHDGLTWDLAPA